MWLAKERHGRAASGFRIPRTKKYNGFWAFCITAVLELVVVTMDPKSNQAHFWAWMIAFPACSGLLTVLIYGYRDLRTFGECMRASQRSLALSYMILLLPFLFLFPMVRTNILVRFYVVAVIYGLVFAPFAIVLAAAGGTLGYWIQMAAPRKVELAPMPYVGAQS